LLPSISLLNERICPANSKIPSRQAPLCWLGFKKIQASAYIH
jgi:hypothetical protein